MRFIKWIVLTVAGLSVGGIIVIAADGLTDSLGHADLGVVLATTVGRNGRPSHRLESRLVKTAELYRAGYFPIILTSGGFGKEGFKEADVMKADLVRQGIPADRILVDNDSRDTYATARNTARIMKDLGMQRVFVVSQYFHLPRTRLAFWRFGFSTVYFAHADYFDHRDLYSLPRELVGIAYYWFRAYPHPHER